MEQLIPYKVKMKEKKKRGVGCFFVLLNTVEMTQSACCVQSSAAGVWGGNPAGSCCTFSHTCHPLLTLLFLPSESTPSCRVYPPADGDLGRKGNTESVSVLVYVSLGGIHSNCTSHRYYKMQPERQTVTWECEAYCLKNGNYSNFAQL